MNCKGSLMVWLDPMWFLDESPWWKCIEFNEVFFSATMCCCPGCNPFSGICRTCHPSIE